MNLDLLNLIPDELLNLIFKDLKPSIKYNLNKKLFHKFYKYRFCLINNKFMFRKSFIGIHDFFYINNINYINYIIKKDCLMHLNYLIVNKIKYDNKNFIFNNFIYFQNYKFLNLIDLIFCLSKKYNSNKIYEYILLFIKNNKLTELIKKEHKYNYKNNNNNNKKIWKI
tara:strand:- start:1648 stop:2151 length:504 start_codon:yes stop_codon:yes gene_type:complete